MAKVGHKPNNDISYFKNLGDIFASLVENTLQSKKESTDLKRKREKGDSGKHQDTHLMVIHLTI